MNLNESCQNCTQILKDQLNQMKQQQCLAMLLVSIIFLFGLFKIIKIICRMISPLSWFSFDLQQRYKNKQGKSWALITGASQGIGFAFAQSLAKRNFNLILMSRSQTKLQKAKHQLQKINQKIKINIIPVDFQQLRKPQQYQNLIQPIIKQNLDISILVNNVGIYNSNDYLQNSYEDIKRQAVVNILPITILSRLIIPLLLKRDNQSVKKGAIINLSSSAVLGLFSHSSHYCATKAYDDLLSRSLQNQYPQIDFLSVRPYLVTSSMTKNMKSFLHVTSNQCAEGALKDLGKFSFTYGNWWHRIQGVIVQQFQGKIINKILSAINKNLSNQYKKIQNKQK